MEPTDFLVTDPALQIIGRSQRGSARCLRPTVTRNRRHCRNRCGRGAMRRCARRRRVLAARRAAFDLRSHREWAHRAVLPGRAEPPVQAQIGGRDILRAVSSHQPVHKRGLGLVRGNRQSRVVDDALLIVPLDVGGAGGGNDAGFQSRELEHPRRRTTAVIGHDQRADPPAPGSSGAAGSMQQRIGVGRHVGMDDQDRDWAGRCRARRHPSRHRRGFAHRAWIAARWCAPTG